MPSLGSVLGAARSALAAQQQAIQTAGHNVANASTPGFTRQRVELAPNFEQRTPIAAMGTGVVVTDVRRVRDALLDVTVRNEAGGEAAASTRKELLAAVEGVLGEPSDTGLASAMDAMWSAWSDLATSPTSRAARSVVLGRAAAVADTLNNFDARLGALRDQTTARVDHALVEVNDLTRRVADLNAQIASTEVGGLRSANDLRDQRDLAVDQLATLVGATATERPDGSVQVFAGGYALVDGLVAKGLTRTTDVLGRTALAMGDAPGRPLRALGGSTEALLGFLNADLRATQDQLDATATGLARAVNAVHGSGQTAGGAAGVPVFVDRSALPPAAPFDPTASPFADPPAAGAVSARTIAVNTALEDDAGLLTTTSSSARPTGNDVALAMAALRTTSSVTVGAGAPIEVRFQLPNRTEPPPAGGPTLLAATAPTTLADFYRSATSDLGVRVRSAASDAEVHAALAEQARGRRDAVSGVNVDEELTNLMRAQQAYAAAAKVVTAADEMVQSLLQMV